MKHYFEHFPIITYDMGMSGVVVSAVDISRRYTLREFLKTYTVIYEPYYVSGGERPDVVAQKYYGDAKLDWLVLIANDVFDPYFQWPMDHFQFIKHIKAKYGDLSTAHQTVHHYEWILVPATVVKDGLRVDEKVVWIDETTYNATPENERRSVSLFDQEKIDNDKRKKLKLIHKQYSTQIIKEVEAIFNG